MKKMIIIAAMLLSAGAAQAADGFDITAPQTAILAIIVALGGFLAAVGVAKVSLNGGIWGWKKISSMVSSR